MLGYITPVILTYNEEPNIRRALSGLDWAERIIVVDSGSTDSTLAILRADSRVTVLYRNFDTHAAQWDFAVNRTDIHTDWVLRLDADYVITPELCAELAELDPNARVSAYRIGFDYIIYERRLRGTIYPPNTVLFRRGRATTLDEGHTEAWAIDGEVSELKGRILHDDRKPLARWFASQQRYATKNADYLLSSRREGLNLADRARLSGWAAPLGVFLHVLFVKGCILDGWAGWYYALQRTTAEILVSLELIDRRLRGTSQQ
jgi:glycosyltransferase involved in cell wall biosynthesis